jgi:hypothetical protein
MANKKVALNSGKNIVNEKETLGKHKMRKSSVNSEKAG